MCQDHHPQHGAMNRRGLFVTGAAAALTLNGVSFASGAERRAPGRDRKPGSKETRTVRGTLPVGAPDFVYLPLEIPDGVSELRVAYSYQKPPVPAGTQGNALDIGVFDERGTDLGGKGFRGWSGGARTEFFIRADDATPGYIPGRVRPGTWHIALGPYTVAPEGLPYEVTITLTYGAPGSTPRPVYPPERAKGRGRAWYRGDCHLHSVHSDGRRTPAEIAALARAAGLDFINSSEHNTHSAHAHWAAHAGDDLLIMLGEEVTTRNGHVVALGTDPGTFVDWRYRARDNRFGRYARKIRDAGGLVVPAHPHATCVGCNWKFGFGEADAVEVWNGPYTPDDEVSLADWDSMLVASVRGGKPWIPALGNSDAHRDPDRIGGPQTVVLADDLTRDAILEGLRRGRSYVAESKEVELSFSAAGGRARHAGIGERLPVDHDTPVTVRLDVKGAPGCTVRIITDQGVLHTTPPLPASGTGTVEWRTTPSYAAYVRAELRHPAPTPPLPGPLRAFTNPIFLGT
ncbi:MULTISPECIES: CehA/McbA family metallohydrolase [Streptomyces]|uniref:CehA/McbA family metallohydrolase n=1 Tax=Streptomyces TaxID=1883 RepID=UPI001E3D5E45|nr:MULTISPECIES: CehA/McbA family metallohydrolase [Streptomyces]UFQ16275.1 CehA/McbA family metallohydrolase [Streptomyces huasconensis]WCL85879.1 CehA/McbA family metallohydrolase [Streptomyces sp. JCM 35825]